MISSSLIKKYDVPAPRYTSYPTVPYWETPPTTEQWIAELGKAVSKPETRLSVYIHIPYCETLCTFCGCNTTITKDHKKEEPYVKLIHHELAQYMNLLPQLGERELLEIHLGGGTPTFLSPANLENLIKPFLNSFSRHSNLECSIEVDPRRTSNEQLSVLRNLGFKRLSMGVQDFDPEVQRLVNRHQPQGVTRDLLKEARHLGYDSVNFDLIYGLPRQTLERMKKTVETTIEMRPDRIALYSYAHVPWIKPAQRLFTEKDLPIGEEKRKLYELALEALAQAGYLEIGMDHFALKNDKLTKAFENKTLHRNFMGYTAQRTEVLLGFGVSAISETPTCFHQNEKTFPVYERRVLNSEIPTLRGHLLTDEDQEAREQILQLMTRSETFLKPHQGEEFKKVLAPLIEDGIAELHGNNFVRLTPEGKPFLRNLCMAFDRRLRAKTPEARLFSQSL